MRQRRRVEGAACTVEVLSRYTGLSRPVEACEGLHSKRTSLVLELATRGFLVTSKMGVRSTTSPSSNVQVTRTRNIHHVTDTYSTMRVTRSSVHKPNLVADGSNQGYSSEEDILPGGPLLEINEMPQPTASDVAARWINIYHVGVCC